MSKTFNNSASESQIEKIKSAFNTEVQLLSLTENIRESIESLSPNTDALYLAIPYGLEIEEYKEISNILIEKKIPTFCMSSIYVEQGFLASMSNENGYEQVKRKLAIMFDDAQQGEPLEKMPVYLNLKKELYFNAVTAQKIGLSPTFETMLTANIIGNEEELNLKQYSIESILEIAIEENLDIKISESDISIKGVDVKLAKSAYLPEAGASSTGVLVNEESSNPLIGQAEQSLKGTLNASQVLFSEQSNANIKIKQLLETAQQFANKQVVYDIMYDCYQAYFNILKSKTSITIQNENLKVSERNLEIARLKSKIGQTSDADIYRWESEVANANQKAIEAFANLAVAKAQLTKILNGKIEMEFDIEDALLTDSIYQGLINTSIGQYIKGPVEFGKLTSFLITEAQTNYPSKQQLLTNKEVLDRQETMYKRMYVLPTLSASAQYNSTFWRGGNGSEPLPGTEFINNNWNVGVTASLPIFSKNNRRLNLTNTHIQQEQLTYQIDNFDQNLRLGVINQSTNLFTSATNIGYSQVSSESAEKSFEIIQQNYQQGLISVTQLVDAQRAKIQSKQAYSIAVYNYLQSFIALEYQIGFFSSLASEEELNSFNERLKEHILTK